jgi:hypothetical protein
MLLILFILILLAFVELCLVPKRKPEPDGSRFLVKKDAA